MRISRTEMLLDIAGIIAKRSTCSRNAVGCVLSHEGRILSTGYNGAPAGMTHCDHTCTCLPAMVKHGHTERCPLVRPCLVSVHAEANAVAYAARHGVRTQGCSAYLTLSPCVPCAQLLINSGVMTVWFSEWYRDRSGVELLVAAGVWTEGFKV